MFRDSTGYIERYFRQVAGLRQLLEARGDELWLALAEGDSVDATWDRLRDYFGEWKGFLIKRAHGSSHPWHWSDVPERWAAISWVCNGIIEKVQEDPDVDVFLYVESDLGWAAEMILELVDKVGVDRPTIAPLVFAGENFYDTWGHIGMDGGQFGPFSPYHCSLEGNQGEMVEVYSAGSCIAMSGDVVRAGVRWDKVDHCRGLGRAIRTAGFSLWVDPTLRVVHY